jgi:hypothetical protein
MAEDLSQLWGKLSLDEGEIMEVAIQPQSVEGVVSRGKFCLVGKLLTDRFVGKDVIRRTLIRGWRPTGNLSFKVVGENVFIMEFEKEGDKVRVLKGRPWICDGNLFSIEDFDGRSSPAEINFFQAAFWVRMINLPLACMGKEVGHQIGATMGTVEEVDTNEEGIGWGKSLRVRVKIDLTKPLARGRVINLLGKQTLIGFQYEKLPKYCFECGRIWHGRMGCTAIGGNRTKEPEKQYGPWLRVPSPRRRRELSNTQYFDVQGEGKGENQKTQTVVNNLGTGGSRTPSDSGGAAAKQANMAAKTTSPTNLVETPASGGRAVLEKVSKYGKETVTGVNHGGINGKISVDGRADSQTMMERNHVESQEQHLMAANIMQNVMERNQVESQEEQLIAENIMHAVMGMNLKGKEEDVKVTRRSNEGARINEKIWKEKTKEENNVTVQENRLTKGVPRGETINDALQEDGGNQFHGVQKWKRRAREGQKWPSEVQPASTGGKRKNLGGKGTENDEEKGARNRRLKYKGENALVLQDEEENSIDGSGLAGTVSQPRRPV